MDNRYLSLYDKNFFAEQALAVHLSFHMKAGEMAQTTPAPGAAGAGRAAAA